MIFFEFAVDAVSASDRHISLDTSLNILVEPADCRIDSIERLAYLGIVIADVDDRSNDSSAGSCSQCSADVISGQRAYGVGALRSIYEVECRSDR